MKNWLNEHIEESYACSLSKWKSILSGVLQFTRDTRPVMSLIAFILFASLEDGIKMAINLQMMQEVWKVH